MPDLKFSYLDSILNVPAPAWDKLLPQHAFSSHTWLSALEKSGLVGRDQVVQFRIPVLHDEQGTLVAAAPGVLKRSTLGEYGPENLWIRQTREQGVQLLPKMQLEIPMTPVASPKFLVHPDWPQEPVGKLLLRALLETTSKSPYQALTIARMSDTDLSVVNGYGLTVSNDVNSVWHNKGYSSYADYLSRFKSYYRNKINRERRAFSETGLSVRLLRGADIGSKHWDDFFAGYVAVCRYKQSPVLLNRGFFDHLSGLGDAVLLIAAYCGDSYKSGNLLIQSGDTLYSRNWSELEYSPFSLFELGCHRIIELAIDLQLARVDSGVWGAHKAERGLEPEAFPNAHWFRDPNVRALAANISKKHTDGIRNLQAQSSLRNHFHADKVATND